MVARGTRWWLPVSAALALVAGLAAAAPAGADPGAADPAERGGGAVVRTDSGPVRGVLHPEYRSFQGIPFAAPPVGDLRWRPPRPVRPWTEPRDASAPGHRCPQSGEGTGGQEDCLYLNVTTPRAPHRGPRPVLVWVHGGGFTSGAGSDYDPHRLVVGGDVVVVTVNYRLGVFGFFGHPALGGDSGSFGLEDQRAALRWVQRNAAAFGGDPGNVTVFGESAGGLSTCALLTAPSTTGLFQKVGVQSGPCTMSWPNDGLYPGLGAGAAYLPRSLVEDGGAQFAAARGCPDPATALDCLRRQPADQVRADPAADSFSLPAYGTDLLPEDPAVALRAGHFHRVPVLMGTTRDEGRLFASIRSDLPLTEQRYQDLLRGAFGDQAGLVAARYPSGAPSTPGTAWSDVITDRVFSCRTLVADEYTASRTRTWGYEFADRRAPALLRLGPGIQPGAGHASELPYLFDLGRVRLDPDQLRLADQLIGYWARFAATGNPNGGGAPRWDRFPAVQSLDTGADGIHPVDLAAEHRCDLWRTITS